MENVSCKLSTREVELITNVLEALAIKYEKFEDQYSNGHDAAEEVRSLIVVLKQKEVA